VIIVLPISPVCQTAQQKSNLIIIETSHSGTALLKTAFDAANELGWMVTNSDYNLQYFYSQWRMVKKSSNPIRLFVSVSNNKLYIRAQFSDTGLNATMNGSSLQLYGRVISTKAKHWQYLEDLADKIGYTTKQYYVD